MGKRPPSKEKWPIHTIQKRWKIYEREKKMIQGQNLSPMEYEQAMRELCRRLGI